jgi:hypothetical protein
MVVSSCVTPEALQGRTAWVLKWPMPSGCMKYSRRLTSLSLQCVYCQCWILSTVAWQPWVAVLEGCWLILLAGFSRFLSAVPTAAGCLPFLCLDYYAAPYVLLTVSVHAHLCAGAFRFTP